MTAAVIIVLLGIVALLLLSLWERLESEARRRGGR